jgi:malonyl CoA-acyl carrier protein transacylase
MTAIYVFPGQGSQALGMGRDLFPRYPHIVAQADLILGYSIVDLCLEGPAERLNDTRFTQPAMFVVNALSYLEKVRNTGVLPACVAGHSLGEYNALFAAGAFDFATGLELVNGRAAAMGAVSGGGMAAVLGCASDIVVRMCGEHAGGSVDVANLNAPAQTVISGPLDAVSSLGAALQRHGAQVIPLRVSAPFHSRYMKPAADAFGPSLSGVRFARLAMDVIANVTARPYESSDSIAACLTAQITQQVRWLDTVRYLATRPEAVIEEVGPGRVLSSLLRQIEACAS